VAPEREVARLQLEAQLLYRMGKNREAIIVYSRLFQEHKVCVLQRGEGGQAPGAVGG
jgi:hypothetical protein